MEVTGNSATAADDEDDGSSSTGELRAGADLAINYFGKQDAEEQDGGGKITEKRWPVVGVELRIQTRDGSSKGCVNRTRIWVLHERFGEREVEIKQCRVAEEHTTTAATTTAAMAAAARQSTAQ